MSPDPEDDAPDEEGEEILREEQRRDEFPEDDWSIDYGHGQEISPGGMEPEDDSGR